MCEVYVHVVDNPEAASVGIETVYRGKTTTMLTSPVVSKQQSLLSSLTINPVSHENRSRCCKDFTAVSFENFYYYYYYFYLCAEPKNLVHDCI